VPPKVLGRSIDRRLVSTVARIFVAGVFLFSGFAKVVDIDGTIRQVRAYRLLPEAVVPTVGSGLPILEIALGVLLLAGLLTRFSAVMVTLVSAAFFIGISQAWARGLQINCGCFGNDGLNPHPVPGYIRELVLNALLITACSWLIRRPGSRWSLDAGLGLTLDDHDDDEDDADSEVPAIPLNGVQQ